MYNGVLTGCDEPQEWMLKWWWKHYSKHNHYPVTFIDFGMSPSARKWCEKRGTLIEVPTPTVATLQNQACEKIFPKEERKNVWFYKPLAMLNAPYEINLWLDIDCKVKQNLSSLFSFPFKDCALSLDSLNRHREEKQGKLIPPEAPVFNSGVILYKKTNTVIQKWAERALLESQKSYGDQDALNRLLFEEKISISHLPKKFNFLYPYKDNEENIIYHYVTPAGKLLILEEINHGP